MPKGTKLILQAKSDTLRMKLHVDIVKTFDSDMDAQAWYAAWKDAIRLNLATLEKICSK